MAIEVACGNCQGRLMVPAPGVVVACPHCGAHLTVPAPFAPEVAGTPAGPPTPPTVQPPAVPPTPPASESPAAPQTPASGATGPVPDFGFLEAPDHHPAAGFPSFHSPAAETAPSPSPPATGESPPFPSPPAAASAAPESTPKAAANETIATADSSPQPPATEETPPQTSPDVAAADPTAPTPDVPASATATPASPPVEEAPLFPGPPAAEQTAPQTIPDVAGTDAAAPPADTSVPAAQAPVPATTEEAPLFPGPPLAETPPTSVTPIVPAAAPVVPPQPTAPAATAATAEEPPLFPGPPATEDTAAPPSTPVVTSAAPAVTPAAPVAAAQPLAQVPTAATPSTTESPLFPGPPAAAPPQTPQAAPAAIPMVETVSAAAPAGTQPVAVPAKAPVKPDVVPKLWFILVASYASAVTIALILLWWSLSNVDPHRLESLPDLKPPKKNGGIALKLAPEDAKMPPGHTLKLGEEQRFGNVLVKPVQVIRGPLEFVHYSDAKKTRPPTGPVLKLYLRFENVSDKQLIAPLDHDLLLTRHPDDKSLGKFRANTFVCQAEQKRRDGHRLLVYDLPPTGDWDLKGQNVGRELKPGDSFSTYIASETGDIEKLKGELIWRVHFRKGYSPKGYGVTTLIEVSFHSDEIKKEKTQS